MDSPRAQSACDSCGAVDDRPKHHVAIFGPEGSSDAPRGVSRHFTCCSAEGCPDGSCDQILAQGQVA
jgi:hypothetical protein